MLRLLLLVWLILSTHSQRRAQQRPNAHPRRFDFGWSPLRPFTLDTRLNCPLPPFLQRSFHACRFVEGEAALITATINALLSFNPDLLVAIETQRDSVGYLVDRCEFLHIPATLLLSRCPFALVVNDVAESSQLAPHFFVDEATREYRYDGHGDHPLWESRVGVANVNEANTAYNQAKGSTLSLQGRYGERGSVG